MSTIPESPNSALLVVDVQNGVLADAWHRDEVIATIGTVVAKARSAGIPVIWIQDAAGNRITGTEPWQIVDALEPAENEPRIEKHFGDAFEATDLREVLARGGVGRVVVVGAQTDACIRSTLHGAFVRGYDTILVADAHTTEDLTEWGAPAPEQVVAHTNLYWSDQSAPGREADVVDSDQLWFVNA